MNKPFAIGLASLALVTALAVPRALRADDDPPPVPAKVGQEAPTFTLETLDGSEISTADLKGHGKTVVLQWIDADCPYVLKHWSKKQALRDLAREFKDKDVTWLLIASGKSADRTRLSGRGGEWKLEVPVLLDPTFRVAKMFGATTTMHTAVIDEKGKLVYMGAVDDKAEGDALGQKNYVERTLRALEEGEKIETPSTFPYGTKIQPASLD